MTHSPILETATLHWPDEAACAHTAQALADAQPRDAVLTLEGELGAGKTTFTRHLLHALGVQGRIKSPTYAVMESYEVGWSISHFDFYRFSDPQEWEDAGFRDVFAAPGLKICEWPAQASGLMPQADVAMQLAMMGADGVSEAAPARRVHLLAYSAEGSRLVRAMRDAQG